MLDYGMTKQAVLGLVQSALIQHRDGLEAMNHLHKWSAGISASDLVTAYSFSTSDANAILSAIADGYAEYQIHLTGQAPGTYPQVTGTPYVYEASQSAVVGPLNA